MTSTPLYRRLFALFCVVVLAFGAAAGCSSSSSGSADAPTPSNASASLAGGAAGMWREFVACARSAGQTNWPDAQVDENGRATFPQTDAFNLKNGFEAVRQQCARLLENLPPQANPYNLQLSPNQIEAVRRYVDCLHQHGMPDVPAPDAEGHFTEPDRYRQQPYLDVRNAARDACDQILTEATE